MDRKSLLSLICHAYPVTEEEVLSQIVKEFNDLFGDYPFTDKDRVLHTVMHELPEMVRSNESYQNAIQNSDIQNARSECEDATKTAVNRCITSDMELFRAFTENEVFRKWVMNLIFLRTYEKNTRSDNCAPKN